MMDRLPPNPLQALTDEIARILPSLLSEHPAGPSLREVAAAIAASIFTFPAVTFVSPVSNSRRKMISRSE